MIDCTETLGKYFLAHAKKHPEKVFLARPEETITYAEAAVRVAATVARLQWLGLKAGDHVGCYLEEQVPALFFNLACASSGVIPAPLSPIFTVDYFIEGIVKELRAKAVFSTLRQARHLTKKGLRPICYVNDRDIIPEGVKSLDEHPDLSYSNAIDLLERASHGISGDDVLIVSPTSGSTGKPKLVVRRNIAPVRYAHFVGDQIQPQDEPEREHRFLMIAALTHAFGLHMLTTALRLGASLCVSTQIDTGADLDEVRALDPTVLPMVPRVQRSFYHQWLAKKTPDKPIFGPSARIACSAGGCPTPEILRTMEAQGLCIIEFYGSTEASVVAVTPRGRWKAGSSGKPVSDVSLKIADDGELLVRSPGVTPGYLGDEKLNHDAFTDEGFFQTGDLAEITTKGSLKIVGRKRDVFNTQEGTNIYPERIENLIESAPWAEQVILIGDQKPYLTALIAVDETLIYGGAFEANGFLPEHTHRGLYEHVGAELAEINEELERIERVVRFALFAGRLENVYAIVGPGKIRRDRKQVSTIYRAMIERLYNPDTLPDASFVPGVDRRLRPRERRMDDDTNPALPAYRP
jgi:long-subunit acyl-CoA synthetase (AMP-forming)